MGEFATGVTVIITVDDQGQPHSMTANSFTSVCLDPPVLLVCVAHGTHTYGYLESKGRFGVNVLGREQQELGGSRRCGQERSICWTMFTSAGPDPALCKGWKYWLNSLIPIVFRASSHRTLCSS